MSIANWVKETTATTGTGTITLGGATDNAHTTFSSQYIDGQYASYVIENGDNRENGVGIYSAGTLTRTNVKETIVSGSFDGTTRTAINLTGSSVVMVAPTAQSVLPGLLPDIESDKQVINPLNIPRSGDLTCVPDRLYCVPLHVLSEVKLVSLLIYSTETAATVGGVARMGLYEIGINGFAGKLITETASTLDLTTATFNKFAALTAPIWVRPGYYYIGILTDSNAGLDGTDTNFQSQPFGGTAGNTRVNQAFFSFNITPGWSAMPSTLEAVVPDLVSIVNEMPRLSGRT